MDAYQFSQVLPASCVAYSPGSTFIATAVHNQVHVRSSATLDCVRSWKCEPSDDSAGEIGFGFVDELKWSPDGSHVSALSTRAGTVWVFDLATNQLITRIGGQVSGFEWGANVVVTNSERGIATYDIFSGECRFVQGVQGDLRYMAVSERHNGKEYVGVYDREELVRHFEVCTTETTGLSWSPCGKWLSVLDWALSFTIHFYSPVGAHVGSYTSSGSPELPTGSASGIGKTAWSPSGSHIAIADSAGTVRILESENWSCVANLSGCAPTALMEPPKGALTASESIVQFIHSAVSTPNASISRLGFSSDGSLLFLSQEATLNVYSCLPDHGTTSSPTFTRNVTLSFNDPIRHVECCPATNRLAIATRSDFLYLLDAHGVEGVRVPSSTTFTVTALKWSPDGRAIAVCDKTSFAIVYDDTQDQGDLEEWEEE